jgi:hypothetical protein
MNRTGSRKLMLKIGKLDYPIWQTRLFDFVDSSSSQGTIDIDEESLP